MSRSVEEWHRVSLMWNIWWGCCGLTSRRVALDDGGGGDGSEGGDERDDGSGEEHYDLLLELEGGRGRDGVG